MPHDLVPEPREGRVFPGRRPIRLSDRAPDGRLRLDAVARYLQDVASDDVADAGWSADEHVWVVRRSRVDVVPPVADDRVELRTWCSGTAGATAARRTTLTGDRGGRVEAESIWIHLDRSGRPARLSGRFAETYLAAAGGRRASARLVLEPPPADAPALVWPLRATDLDLLGHVNNAAYWAALEELLFGSALLAGPFTARLEFAAQLDLGERVELRHATEPGGGLRVAFAAGGEVRATARVAPLAVA